MEYRQCSMEEMLDAYRAGWFPMAESRDAAEFRFYRPHLRGILPLDDGFHLPRSLKRVMRRGGFEIRTDTAFSTIIRACADRATGSWINDAIIRCFEALHREGYAHSVECWRGDRLAGGLYGLALGGAFLGESMVSFAPNASKIALAALVEKLRQDGFVLLDAQLTNEHLRQFGLVEIADADYMRRLTAALALPNRWGSG